MKLMNSLALRHLKRNKKQSFSALLAITLAVSMLVAISSFFFSVYDSTMTFAQANNLTDTMGSSMNGLITVGVLLGIVISGAAVVVISSAFSIQAAERRKQFGILKSVGASEAQIKSTVTAEGNWLSLIGIPAGIVLGHVLCFAALMLMKNTVDSGDSMTYNMSFNVIAIAVAAALGYATVRVASAMTAGKASRLSAIEAIRQTDEINMNGDKLKTSRLMGKLFGFEGTLAAKQLKRGRRKFRVTVLSLTTSVVLLLGAFSFGDTLIKTALGAFADTGANVVINISGGTGDFEKFDAYATMLTANKPKSMYALYSYRHVPNEGQPNEGQGDSWYNVITMDDAAYAAYCKSAGVPEGANILLDTKNGMGVPLDIKTDAGEALFSATAMSAHTNPYIRSITFDREPNVVMPRGAFQRLNIPVEASYYIVADNAIDFIAKVKPEHVGFDPAGIRLHNTEEFTRELQRMYAVLMAFVYCLIAMLALIGATSALATINSNINLRRAEFAMLRAVGMETRKLHKMLNIESLLYGVKALLYGLPVGLALSYGMSQLALSGNTRFSNLEGASFSYELPYIGILVCVVGVFAVNLASMYYATGKIRRSNIAESMRELSS